MRIRVGTLNVWALPEPFAEDVSARMRAIGRRLATFDVDLMAFQEVWTTAARRRLVVEGHRVGLVQSWYGDSGIRGSGLLVLSRLPIESVHFEPYALTGHPERLANGEFLSGKGFAEIKLRTASGPLTVLNTHLHARYGNESLQGYRAHRTGQIVQLAGRSLTSREPIVALGDFNFGEGDPEYAVLTGLTGLRDTAAELDAREPTVLHANTYRNSTHKPDRRVDFVFVRDGSHTGLRAVQVDRILDEPLHLGERVAAYSDHAGVVAEVELGGAPSRPQAPLPRAIELAHTLLAQGRAQAERRRQSVRTWAGAGVGVAALAAAAGVRGERVTRRRWLRNTLRGAALVALTPGLGGSLLSEFVVPWEIDAFRDARARLAQLERDGQGLLTS